MKLPKKQGPIVVNDPVKIAQIDWDIPKTFELDVADKIQTQVTICNLLLSTKREGIDALVDWLKKSSFFVDPASANYHLSCPGGLAWHSLSVYNTLRVLVSTGLYGDIKEDSMIITALLHDVCKVGTYNPKIKNVKVPSTDGKFEAWMEVNSYEYKEDDLPLGHGEKSLYIIQKFIQVTDEEALMIRHHMGAFSDSKTMQNDYSKAARVCHGALALHIADATSTSAVEEDYVQNKIQNP